MLTLYLCKVLVQVHQWVPIVGLRNRYHGSINSVLFIQINKHNSFPSTTRMLLELPPKIEMLMTSLHFRNYLRSVSCTLEELSLAALQSYCKSCLVAHVFCWNSGSDHRYTCEQLLFIIQLVLRLLYCACQLNIIACMLVVVYHIR